MTNPTIDEIVGCVIYEELTESLHSAKIKKSAGGVDLHAELIKYAPIAFHCKVSRFVKGRL